MNRNRSIALIGLMGVGAILLGLPEPTEAVTAPPEVLAPEEVVSTRHQRSVTYSAAASVSSSIGAETYRSGERMVALSPGALLDEVAEDHGLQIQRRPGPSGYAVLTGEPDDLAALRADSRVRSVTQNARTFGADDDDDDDDYDESRSDLASLKWHEPLVNVPVLGYALDFSDITVAVLDTGVAYEAIRGQFAKAASMEGVGIVAPYDFVNDDEHPNDDHQHGTHIANLILGTGDVGGIAPGASLMPLKVLDSENTGSEAALIDAIWWAVDHGADIINMSLTFGLDYAPSAALTEALDHAHRSGVVMIGATGNDGADKIGWPAASPAVIAVGSACVDEDGVMFRAPYSNIGPQMDVMAPGGCLDIDANGDGVADGLLAETIKSNNPRQTEHWLYAGTSQAAALVSGAAVWLLKAGAAPGEVPLGLQYTAQKLSDGGFSEGRGAGMPDIFSGALVALDSPNHDLSRWFQYHTAIMPYIVENDDGTVMMEARLETLDVYLAPASDVTVYGHIEGASSGRVSCELTVEDDGVCIVNSPPVDPDAVDVMAWTISVDAVNLAGVVSFRPGGLMFASDGLEALAASDSLYGALPAMYWPEGAMDSPAVMESYAVVNSGTGIATSPIGVVFPPRVIEDLVEVGSLELELDLGGTGIATSPIRLRTLSFTGTGIATSPLGLLLEGKKLVAIEGTGIATSPLSAIELYTRAGVACAGCTFQEDPMLLSSQKIAGGVGAESVLAVQLSEGGWVSSDGYPAASLVGAGVVAVPPVEEAMSVASLGAERINIRDLLSNDDDDGDDD